MEEKNNSAIDRLKKLDTILDEYERSIGLSVFKEQAIEDEASNYLSMTRQEIELMTIEQCAEASLMLGGLAFYIQRAYNREVARVNWASSVLKKTVAGRKLQYKGSWESQFHQAIKNDEYCRKILDIKSYAQQRADRITFLSNSIKNLSDLFINLQRAKGLK